MLLHDDGLRAAISFGALGIDPFTPELIQPASVEVRLDSTFALFTGDGPIDPSVDQSDLTRLVEVPAGEAFILAPHAFVLASTMERVSLDKWHAARVEGKSSLGRLGLRIHSTAGFIDPGFSGHVTLEIKNDQPHHAIRLHPGMLIGQLAVFRLDGPARTPYGSAGAGSHYQGQRGPTPSRSWERWRTWPTGS